MKIAVTFENGNVFQHFGRTEQFKLYETEDGKILSSEVRGTDGIGHEALADLLADWDVGTLICGGMGPGAQAALSEAGLEVIAGASGSADDAVAACAAKAVKMRRESIEQFEKAGREDLATNEKVELECLSMFTPKTLSEDETRTLVDKAIADGATNIGAVMKALPKTADKKFASAYAKEKFVVK